MDVQEKKNLKNCIPEKAHYNKNLGQSDQDFNDTNF